MFKVLVNKEYLSKFNIKNGDPYLINKPFDNEEYKSNKKMRIGYFVTIDDVFTSSLAN
jgi:hypothetical protein